MAFSKAHVFPKNEYHFALQCKLLSHPARIRILRRILENQKDGISFDKLVKGIPLSRNTISQHLQILRRKKIIVSKSTETSTIHFINAELDYTLFSLVDLILNIPAEENQHEINDFHLLE